MKSRSIFSLMVSLSIWSANSLPATSQKLTEKQIRGLKEQISTAVQNSESTARSEFFSAARKPYLLKYRQFWHHKNPYIAKFVGSWIDDSGRWFTIFPTNKPNQVCIQYADKFNGLIERGIIKNGKIYWKSTVLRVDSVLLRPSKSLVVIRIQQGKYNIWPLSIADLPRQLCVITNHPNSYKNLGCITETNVTALR
jgi:hypothetical protein